VNPIGDGLGYCPLQDQDITEISLEGLSPQVLVGSRIN